MQSSEGLDKCVDSEKFLTSVSAVWSVTWPICRDAISFAVGIWGAIHEARSPHPSPEVLLFWGSLIVGPGVVAGAHLARGKPAPPVTPEPSLPSPQQPSLPSSSP